MIFEEFQFPINKQLTIKTETYGSHRLGVTINTHTPTHTGCDLADEVTYPGSPEGEHIPLFLGVRSPRRTEPSRVYLMLFRVPPLRFSLLRLMLQRRRLLIRGRRSLRRARPFWQRRTVHMPPHRARAGSKQASKIQQMSSRGENFHHVTAAQRQDSKWSNRSRSFKTNLTLTASKNDGGKKKLQLYKKIERLHLLI